MGIARKKPTAKPPRGSTIKTDSIEALALPAMVDVDFLFRRVVSQQVLATYVDNVKVAYFSVAEGKLNLGLHLLVLFADSPVSGFRLLRSVDGLDAADLGALETTPFSSPGVGAQHPNLAWASASRFVVDTSFSAPGLRPGDLVTIAAQVGDELRSVALVHITGKAATEGASA